MSADNTEGVIPGEDREAIRGKGTHPRRVCGAKRFFCRADARLMPARGASRRGRIKKLGAQGAPGLPLGPSALGREWHG